MAMHFLPGKSHGQRSLAGYSPWGCKELDTTEHQHHHIYMLYMCIYDNLIKIKQ